MEFGLREYLLFLGAILIVGLLADGIRRTLKHKREGLKLDLMAAPPESPERSDVSKPRPVKKATPEELEPQVNADPLFDSTDASQLNLWAGEIKAEAMKPADTDTLTAPIETDTQTESLFEGYEPQAQTVVVEESVDIDEPMDERVEPVWDEPSITESTDPLIDEQSIDDLFGSALGRIFGRFGKKSADPNPQPEPAEAASDSIEISDDVSEPTREAEPTDSMDDLVVVSIQSARTPRFEGINLHKACLRAGLRRTESQMYQRFPLDESEHPLFSLVNGVEPGTFEEDAKSIDTPVVFLFTELPKQADPVFAVNELISGARSIARDIGGDVFDQQGTPISKEWIDLARAQAGHQTLLRS
ncbi:MAG: hypothetical protein EBW40_02200 [Gammaproteobacteria bacterium]|nr:hypothetical protein [Gammaproteobacteria bacterium]